MLAISAHFKMACSFNASRGTIIKFMINLAQDLHMKDVRRSLMLCGPDWGSVDRFRDFLAIVEYLGIDRFSDDEVLG